MNVNKQDINLLISELVSNNNNNNALNLYSALDIVLLGARAGR